MDSEIGIEDCGLGLKIMHLDSVSAVTGLNTSLATMSFHFSSVNFERDMLHKKLHLCTAVIMLQY